MQPTRVVMSSIVYVSIEIQITETTKSQMNLQGSKFRVIKYACEYSMAG